MWSQPGQGATFTMRLPDASDAAAAERQVLTSPEGGPELTAPNPLSTSATSASSTGRATQATEATAATATAPTPEEARG